MKLPDNGCNVIIVFAGDSAVGKTAMIHCFTKDTVDGTIPTIAADLETKTIEVNGKTIRLQIWDTSGQERFRSVSANYYRKADGVFVVYSVANRKSFENVRYWMDEVEKHAPEHATIILVGNKNDLDNRAVTSQEGKELAASLDIMFMETSAKQYSSIQDAFCTMASRCFMNIAKSFDSKCTVKTDKVHLEKPRSEARHSESKQSSSCYCVI